MLQAGSRHAQPAIILKILVHGQITPWLNTNLFGGERAVIPGAAAHLERAGHLERADVIHRAAQRRGATGA